ncbi:hypothetical protein HTZ77_01045 [Nonomuraea sp. SMC257]|uniref:Uncharacterized protein n=1 Tax=Nonomuraea montanisoli TaxID=2741721 RepID=A0A7Y6I3T7_9ACTN|nr:hypothetical protein [Nonomuraea montanisoli]NUW30024.1 hypothetical protein [Nonomuraea montanisoli]
MGRRTPMLMGLLGLGLAVLGLGLYVSRCDTSFGLFLFEAVAYVVGAGLVGGALILRYRPAVGFSVLILLVVAALTFLGAVLAFFASFDRCFEF